MTYQVYVLENKMKKLEERIERLEAYSRAAYEMKKIKEQKE